MNTSGSSAIDSGAWVGRSAFAPFPVPGKVGAMSGLFFGLAFGLGGIGSAVLGAIADRHGIPYVFQVCSYLPLIGLLTALLPNLGKPRRSPV
jgi:MFS transporter, FSR family, fosmidomycin resistance protein